MLTQYLQPIDTKPLRVFANNRDLLRDLFVFIDYVSEHSIKRMTRTNSIPRGDSVRIAKLLGDKDLIESTQDSGGSPWIDFIDTLAYRLSLTEFNVRGNYRGYSSSEPSFIDNYINVNDKKRKEFFLFSPVQQERTILDTLINAKTFNDFDNYSFNEFYRPSIVGSLDQFSTRGSGVGLMNTLNFQDIRHFLIKTLQNCTPNQWYSTASLIQYLKANHPFFLIPKNAPGTDLWGKPIGRYDNFYEGKDHWASEFTVPVNAPDGFERVVGRYVERFLEYIPLLMRFIDVAYDTKPYTGNLPQKGLLQAFRINERFIKLMKGEMAQPKITVQPNFDVIIESDFYPGALNSQISSLGELVSSPENGHGAYIGIYLLKKSTIAAALIKQPELDVITLLKDLSGRDLPANVQIELNEWAGHADQFTLYDGFAILEMDNIPSKIQNFIIESISPTLHLVREPGTVLNTLETLGKVPILTQHTDQEFTRLAESANTIFPKKITEIDVPKIIHSVKVTRQITVSYKFSEEEVFSLLQKNLAELRCPFHSDTQNRIISIKQQDQAKFDEAVQKVTNAYILDIE